MNIENVKQIFGSPAMGSNKPMNKNSLMPVLIGIVAVVGIATYLHEKKKEQLRQESENTKP